MNIKLPKCDKFSIGEIVVLRKSSARTSGFLGIGTIENIRPPKDTREYLDKYSHEVQLFMGEKYYCDEKALDKIDPDKAFLMMLEQGNAI